MRITKTEVFLFLLLLGVCAYGFVEMRSHEAVQARLTEAAVVSEAQAKEAAKREQAATKREEEARLTAEMQKAVSSLRGTKIALLEETLLTRMNGDKAIIENQAATINSLRSSLDTYVAGAKEMCPEFSKAFEKAIAEQQKIKKS